GEGRPGGLRGRSAGSWAGGGADGPGAGRAVLEWPGASDNLAGLTRGERPAVDRRSRFLASPAFPQGSRVDRGEADALDQLRDHGLGLPIIARDEDCESVLEQVGGAGARLERLPAHRVEGLYETGFGRHLR